LLVLKNIYKDRTEQRGNIHKINAKFRILSQDHPDSSFNSNKNQISQWPPGRMGLWRGVSLSPEGNEWSGGKPESACSARGRIGAIQLWQLMRPYTALFIRPSCGPVPCGLFFDPCGDWDLRPERYPLKSRKNSPQKKKIQRIVARPLQYGISRNFSLK
jgi:hypothetical protein